MTTAIEAPIETTSLVTLRLSPALNMDEEQFYLFCRQNDELRIERTAEGDIEVMPPADWVTGGRNAGLTGLLWAWAWSDGTGIAFDSSTGYTLPNGAVRSPDASWVLRSRIDALTPEDRKPGFIHICPDFAVELRSPSDRLRALQAKMQEYIEQGARLGWLLDAQSAGGRRVYVYRPGKDVEVLDDPPELSGEPELPGFTLDLRQVWGKAP